MRAFIYTEKAKRAGDSWVHPRTGEKLNAQGEGDIFTMTGEIVETGEIFISFAVDRLTLEQVQHGIQQALTVDPVVVRRADG